MLPSTCFREALLASSLESAFVHCGFHPFLVMLSLVKVRFSLTLTLSSLIIWYSGQTALFLLARATPAFLPIALSVALRPLFPFQQAQYVQVFLLKPVPFCTLFVGLGSTNKSAISLLSFSNLTFAVSSPPFFLLSQTLWQIWQEVSSLSSCFINLQWFPGHSFLPGNDADDELARRRALLAPSAIPCSRSPLISRIHSSFFSDWRRTVSSKFFDSQVPSISTEQLKLSCHARCVLFRPRCNRHSLLLSFHLFRIGSYRESFLQRLRTLVPRHFSSHSALSSYGLFAPLALWRLSVSLRPLVQTLGSYPASEVLWSSAMPPSVGRGRITTTTCQSAVALENLSVG